MREEGIKYTTQSTLYNEHFLTLCKVKYLLSIYMRTCIDRKYICSMLKISK